MTEDDISDLLESTGFDSTNLKEVLSDGSKKVHKLQGTYSLRLTSPGLSTPDVDEFEITREEFYVIVDLVQVWGYDFNTGRKVIK